MNEISLQKVDVRLQEIFRCTFESIFLNFGLYGLQLELYELSSNHSLRLSESLRVDIPPNLEEHLQVVLRDYNPTCLVSLFQILANENWSYYLMESISEQQQVKYLRIIEILSNTKCPSNCCPGHSSSEKVLTFSKSRWGTVVIDTDGELVK